MCAVCTLLFFSSTAHSFCSLLLCSRQFCRKKKKVCKINIFAKNNLTLEIKCYVLFANLNPLLAMGSFTLIVTPTWVLCSHELLSLVQLPLNSWADHITSLPQFAFFFFFPVYPDCTEYILKHGNGGDVGRRADGVSRCRYTAVTLLHGWRVQKHHRSSQFQCL